MYIFWFILNVAITNAIVHLLTNCCKEFRAELAIALIGEYNNCKVRGRRPSLPAPRTVYH